MPASRPGMPPGVVAPQPAERRVPQTAAVNLFWIPLGAGTSVVRLNGRVYELFHALSERRRPLALYHCALQVCVPAVGRFAIELAPIPDDDGAARGVVCEGPVVHPWLGRFRLFRYELRCSPDHDVPDIGDAVGGPQRLTDDPRAARRMLQVIAAVPRLTWGRDELRAGEMWNSNSVIAWLLARSGVPMAPAVLPPGGRAPGWNAGLVMARRQGQTEALAPQTAASTRARQAPCVQVVSAQRSRQVAAANRTAAAKGSPQRTPNSSAEPPLDGQP
jgi:hypothetical protein